MKSLLQSVEDEVGPGDTRQPTIRRARASMTLTLLWQEYRATHPDGYGYIWFCERYVPVTEVRAHLLRRRHQGDRPEARAMPHSTRVME